MQICLSLFGSTDEICDQISATQEADLYEIRLDLSSELDYQKIRACTQKPLIFASHEKAELLKEVPRVWDYLDVGPYRMDGKEYIVSVHADDGDPSRLWSDYDGEHITKIVLNTRDYSRIADLLALTRSRHGLCFAMGEVGAFSRVLSGFHGAPWMYASRPGQPTAAGQFTVEELIHTYRIRRFPVEPEAVFGIVGNPVTHSRSPEFHNRKFAETNRNWIYLPFHCEDIQGLFKHALRFDIRGFSITHPFKEKVVRLLEVSSHDVKRLKSCNTVLLKDGKWHGINTDISGFTTLLVESGISLLGSNAIILGAGAAARTIAAVIRPHVSDLLFLGRTLSKAKAAAAAFSGRAGLLQDLAKQNYDVLFNATPVGWNPEECPVNPDVLRKGVAVFDAIYRDTLLLKKARALGCRTFNGELWFQSQAEAQFRWWSEENHRDTESQR